MLSLARLARDTNAAVILAHHARKSDGAYRDSSAIGAGVDGIFEMSTDGKDEAVRNVKARARWPVDNYSVRLVGSSYELSSGQLSLDARVLQAIGESPGCSQRDIRRAVSGAPKAVAAAIRGLITSEAVEDQGDKRGMRLHAVSTPQTEPWDGPVLDSGLVGGSVEEEAKTGPAVLRAKPQGLAAKTGQPGCLGDDKDQVEI